MQQMVGIQALGAYLFLALQAKQNKILAMGFAAFGNFLLNGGFFSLFVNGEVVLLDPVLKFYVFAKPQVDVIQAEQVRG